MPINLIPGISDQYWAVRQRAKSPNKSSSSPLDFSFSQQNLIQLNKLYSNKPQALKLINDFTSVPPSTALFRSGSVTPKVKIYMSRFAIRFLPMKST